MKLKEDEMGGHIACMGEDEKCVQNFGWKPRRKRPLKRPTYKWEDNIIMDLMVMECENVDWMHLAEDRDQLQALVILTFRFHKRWNIS
jgi:hypothetical protein